MDYILIILIGILIAALAITWVKCIQINKNMKEIENELTSITQEYEKSTQKILDEEKANAEE